MVLSCPKQADDLGGQSVSQTMSDVAFAVRLAR